MNNSSTALLFRNRNEHLAEWDGALPIDTFFESWESIKAQRQPLEIEARVMDDHLVPAAPPDSTVKVEGNHIRWEGGREVVIRLAA